MTGKLTLRRGDRLVLLGTGTCQLQEHRAASSVLIELADLRLVFDFGRGVATRLAALGLRQDDVAHVALEAQAHAERLAAAGQDLEQGAAR